MARSRDFPDDLDDLARQSELSDDELARLIDGHSPPAESVPGEELEQLEPGTRLRGTVLECRAGEVLLELDGKTHAVIPLEEFEGRGVPQAGARVEANLVRFDAARGVALLSFSDARREIVRDELRAGQILEGTAVEANRGGIVVEVEGVRVFIPLSQIDLERVEDPERYLRKRMRFIVTHVDRSRGEAVGSRRELLEREREERRALALSRLSEGEVLRGRVVRHLEHGALVDLGGVEGFLAWSRTRAGGDRGARESLEVGEEVEVQVLHVDRNRNRVRLGLHARLEAPPQSLEGYEVGEEVTGWVKDLGPEGARVAVEEGVEGYIPRRFILRLAEPPHRGTVLRARIRAVDRVRGILELEPLPEKKDTP